MKVKYKMNIDSPLVCLMDDVGVKFLLLEYDCCRPRVFVSLEEIHQEATPLITQREDQPMCGTDVNEHDM